MATENAMTISRKKNKVKRKARTQRKKTTSVPKKQRGKKSQSGGKKVSAGTNLKKKRKVGGSQKLSEVSKRTSTKVKSRRPTRAQLEKQLKAAQKKIQRLSSKKADRSAASKKGWETRRRKKAEQAAIAIKESEVREGIVFSSIDKERLEFLERPEVQRQVRDLYIEKIPEFFLQGENAEEWVQQKEPSILRRLIYAQVEGNFDEVAYDIADEYGYEPNEIYSLWHGYKLED